MHVVPSSTAEDPFVAMTYSRHSNKVLLSTILPGQKDVDYKHGGSEKIFVLQRSEQLLPRYVVYYDMLPST